MHKKYEFGAEVSIAVTNREGLVVGMQFHAGNWYDGQTLKPAPAQLERLTGVTPARCYVDRSYRGYRGHQVEGATEVVMAGRRRGLTPTTRREELRRRSAIEAMIGHMKLGRQTRPQSPRRRRRRCDPRFAVRRGPQSAPDPAPPEQ